MCRFDSYTGDALFAIDTFNPQDAMKIRLSTLIRIGADLTEKAIGVYVTKEGNTCAMGAAYYGKNYLEEGEGLTSQDTLGGIGIFYTEIPTELVPDVLEDREFMYGASGEAYIREVIYQLNDEHGWTREAVADWLDMLMDEHGIDIEVSVSLNVEAFSSVVERLGPENARGAEITCAPVRGVVCA